MTTKIRKKKGVEVFKIEQNTITLKEVHFVQSSMRLYFNAQHKLIKLKPLERAYFDFMCEEMNVRNQFELSPSFRKKFMAFCDKVMGKAFKRSERALQNYENHIEKLGLIFKVPDKPTLWYVNPKHVFKETETKRSELLKLLGEQSAFHPNIRTAILDVPDSEVKPTQEIIDAVMPEDWKEDID
jgi:hypothetical protein